MEDAAASSATMNGDPPAPGSETPDRLGAFPRLEPEQLELLEGYGAPRPTAAGDVLFRQGDPRYDFLVVLSGRVAVVGGWGPEERVLGVHGPGRFLGELNLLIGQPVLATAIVREAGEVLALPPEQLRRVATQDTALGDLAVRAFLLRRSMMIELGMGMRIVGSRGSADARRVRDFLSRNRMPHTWIDVDED